MNEETLVDMIYSNYDLNNVKIIDSPQGVSNITRFVIDGEDKYVLRIYKHRNVKKVIYEHEVISKFKKKFLDGSIPDFQMTKTGQTFLQIDDVLMALYTFIPGQSFKRHNIALFGKTVGKTISILKDVTVNAPSEGNLYDDLIRISPAYLPSLHDTLINPPFNFLKEDVIIFIENIEHQISLTSEYSKLPIQLIHGDFTRQNVLFDVEKNLVTGIIDFELASECYKTMDIATAIVSMLRMKYPEEEDMFLRIKELVNGYIQHEELSPIEVELLPDLIMLRLMSISLYHIKRFSASTNDNFIMNYFPYTLAWRKWLSRHSGILKHICTNFN